MNFKKRLLNSFKEQTSEKLPGSAADGQHSQQYNPSEQPPGKSKTNVASLFSCQLESYEVKGYHTPDDPPSRDGCPLVLEDKGHTVVAELEPCLFPPVQNRVVNEPAIEANSAASHELSTACLQDSMPGTMTCTTPKSSAPNYFDVPFDNIGNMPCEFPPIVCRDDASRREVEPSLGVDLGVKMIPSPQELQSLQWQLAYNNANDSSTTSSPLHRPFHEQGLLSQCHNVLGTTHNSVVECYANPEQVEVQNSVTHPCAVAKPTGIGKCNSSVNNPPFSPESKTHVTSPESKCNFQNSWIVDVPTLPYTVRSPNRYLADDCFSKKNTSVLHQRSNNSQVYGLRNVRPLGITRWPMTGQIVCQGSSTDAQNLPWQFNMPNYYLSSQNNAYSSSKNKVSWGVGQSGSDTNKLEQHSHIKLSEIPQYRPHLIKIPHVLIPNDNNLSITMEDQLTEQNASQEAWGQLGMIDSKNDVCDERYFDFLKNDGYLSPNNQSKTQWRLEQKDTGINPSSNMVSLPFVTNEQKQNEQYKYIFEPNSIIPSKVIGKDNNEQSQEIQDLDNLPNRLPHNQLPVTQSITPHLEAFQLINSPMFASQIHHPSTKKIPLKHHCSSCSPSFRSIDSQIPLIQPKDAYYPVSQHHPIWQCPMSQHLRPASKHLRPTSKHPRMALQHPRSASQHPRLALHHPRSASQNPRSASQHPRLASQNPRLASQHPRLESQQSRPSLQHLTVSLQPPMLQHPPALYQPPVLQHPPVSHHPPVMQYQTPLEKPHTASQQHHHPFQHHSVMQHHHSLQHRDTSQHQSMMQHHHSSQHYQPTSQHHHTPAQYHPYFQQDPDWQQLPASQQQLDQQQLPLSQHHPHRQHVLATQQHPDRQQVPASQKHPDRQQHRISQQHTNQLQHQSSQLNPDWQQHQSSQLYPDQQQPCSSQLCTDWQQHRFPQLYHDLQEHQASQQYPDLQQHVASQWAPDQQQHPASQWAPDPQQHPASRRAPDPQQHLASRRAPDPQQRPASQRDADPQQLPASHRDPDPQQLPASHRDPDPQQLPASHRDPDPQQLPTSHRDPDPQQLLASHRDPDPQQLPASHRLPDPQQLPASHRDHDPQQLSASHRDADPQQLPASHRDPVPQQLPASHRDPDPQQLPASHRDPDPQQHPASQQDPEQQQQQQQQQYKQSQQQHHLASPIFQATDRSSPLPSTPRFSSPQLTVSFGPTTQLTPSPCPSSHLHIATLQASQMSTSQVDVSQIVVSTAQNPSFKNPSSQNLSFKNPSLKCPSSHITTSSISPPSSQMSYIQPPLTNPYCHKKIQQPSIYSNATAEQTDTETWCSQLSSQCTLFKKQPIANTCIAQAPITSLSHPKLSALLSFTSDLKSRHSHISELPIQHQAPSQLSDSPLSTDLFEKVPRFTSSQFLSSPMEKKARHCFVPASISSQKLHTPSVPLLSQAHQNAPTGETSNHSAIVSTVPTQRPLALTPHTLQFTQSPTDIPQTVMVHHALPTTTESTPCMPVQKMCIPASEQSVRTLHAHNESGIEHVDSPLAMIKSSSPLHPGMCPLVVVKRLPLQFPFCERVNLSSELLSNEYSSCFDEGPMASIGNGEKSQENNSRVLLSDVSLMEHSSLDLTTVLKDENASAKSTGVCSVERCSPDSSTVEVSSKVWEIFLARHLNMISDGTEYQASDISSNHPTTLMTNLHADLRELAAAGRCPLPCISRLQRVFAPVGALRDLMFSPLLETAVVKIFRRRGVVLRPATLREERELEVVWPMRQNVPRTFTLFPLDKLHEVYMDLIQAAIGDRRKDAEVGSDLHDSVTKRICKKDSNLASRKGNSLADIDTADVLRVRRKCDLKAKAAPSKQEARDQNKSEPKLDEKQSYHQKKLRKTSQSPSQSLNHQVPHSTTCDELDLMAENRLKQPTRTEIRVASSQVSSEVTANASDDDVIKKTRMTDHLETATTQKRRRKAKYKCERKCNATKQRVPEKGNPGHTSIRLKKARKERKTNKKKGKQFLPHLMKSSMKSAALIRKQMLHCQAISSVLSEKNMTPVDKEGSSSEDSDESLPAFLSLVSQMEGPNDPDFEGGTPEDKHDSSNVSEENEADAEVSHDPETETFLEIVQRSPVTSTDLGDRLQTDQDATTQGNAFWHLSDSFPKLVGKRILHLYEDGSTENWYGGFVIGIEQERKNPLDTVYAVKYDSEPNWNYAVELLADYMKGWVKLV